MSNRAILTSWAKTRLQDNDSVLDDVEVDDTLEQALAEYSTRQPRTAVQALAGDGTTLAFAVATDWVPEWSYIRHITKLDANNVPSPVAHTTYYVEQTPSARQIRFESALADATTYHVHYTTSHDLTASSTTIPTHHQRAVATLAAAIGAQWIAQHYAATSDSSFGVDVSDHAGRSERYAERARRLHESFERLVPVWTATPIFRVVRG